MFIIEKLLYLTKTKGLSRPSVFSLKSPLLLVICGFLWRIPQPLKHTFLIYFERTSQSLSKSKKVKMPKPELYVIYTGNKGRKPDTISLSQEFFDGADIDIEIKAKVIYESDKDNIINEYIVFCKVFNEQIKEHGMTKQAVTETIRICKDRNILKQYLSSREVEVVTIMMSLFDDEQIMKSFIKSERHDAERAMAEQLIRKGKMTLEEIADCVSALSFDELKELEAEIMQLA